jgi:SAM-dependent methyltransferase
MTFSGFDQAFDFVLANSVFSHAPPHAIRTGLREAARVMKPDALFLASFMRGSRNYEGESWIFSDDIDAGAPGRMTSLSTYTVGFMEDLCAECGLLVDMVHGIHPGAQTWMVIRREIAGSTEGVVRGLMRRTYAHAPLIPDWPSRPSHISPAVW